MTGRRSQMAAERGTWAPSVLLQVHRRARADQADALRLRTGRAVAPEDGLDVEQCTRLLRHVREELDEIDAATARLRSGRYGRCESCTLRIPPAQLLARPQARCCSACGRSRATGYGPAPEAEGTPLRPPG